MINGSSPPEHSPTGLNFPLPKETRYDKKLDANSMSVLQNQWNLFNTTAEIQLFTNPFKDRSREGKPELAKGTLIHGTTYDLDKLSRIKASGIISGELVGIPEDMETNFCADFFKVPDDMTIPQYLNWVQEVQKKGHLKMKRPELHYLPVPGKASKQVAFLIDSSNPRLIPLIENDAYNTARWDEMSKIVTRLPIPLSSAQSATMSAILCGIPGNFLQSAILGDGLTSDEVKSMKEIMGPNTVLFRTSGETVS